MRLACLAIWLFCLGIQVELVADHAKFVAAVFGPAENPLLTAALVFVGLGAVESMILVLWTVSAYYETGQRRHGQRQAESAAEKGQSSKLAHVRGWSIATMINAFRDRTAAVVGAWRRLGRPFFWAALLFIVLVALLANVALSHH